MNSIWHVVVHILHTKLFIKEFQSGADRHCFQTWDFHSADGLLSISGLQFKYVKSLILDKQLS
jgi:hypothetical protein